MNAQYFLLFALFSTSILPMHNDSGNGHHASTESTKSPEPQQGPTTTVDHHADSHNGHSGK